MNLAILCGVLAGISQIIGYWIYNKGVFSDHIKPNATSWGLWAFGSFLTCLSYVTLTHDWVKEILPFACLLACSATFVACLFKGKFERPDKWDFVILGIDFIVIAFWIITKSTEYTNLLFQVDTVISFIPIIRGTWKDPSTEDSVPWFVWSLAYVFFFLAVVLRFEKWWDLAYPVTYFILHIIVGSIAKFRTVRA